MMVKSGLEKFVLKSLNAGKLLFVTEFVILGKNLPVYEVRGNSLPHEGISKQIFLGHFSPPFFSQKLYFSIDSILRVEVMYKRLIYFVTLKKLSF